MASGRWTFTDPTNNIISITVSNGTDILSNSSEITQITTSVPEPSTWAMLLLGFVGNRRPRPAIGIPFAC